MIPTTPTTRYTLTGFAAIAALILLVRLCIGLFTLEFDDAETVTVRADRSGLLLETHAAVKFHGISVGRVSEVTLRDGAADVVLAIESDQLRSIPANVTASIVPTTLLGSKFVELRESGRSSGTPLAPGAVIADVHNTSELNETFDSLARVLTALQPAQVSAVLHSMSGALDGNGQPIRLILDDLEEILPAVNAQSRHIEGTLTEAPPVLDGYEELTDPFVETLINAGALSSFLESRASELAGLLDALTATGLDVGQVLIHLELGLGAAVSTLRPTLELLSRFSSIIPCFLRGHEEFGERARAVFGGPNKGGTHRQGHVTISVVRSQPAYEFPKNLPKVAATGDPNCHGLPLPASPPPFTSYDVGANPYPDGPDDSIDMDTPLGIWLFGDQLKIVGQP